jgi:hypothetical protein
MRRWEIRRMIQETQPFDPLLLLVVTIEKLMEKGILNDEDFCEMLRDQVAMAESVPHYE